MAAYRWDFPTARHIIFWRMGVQQFSSLGPLMINVGVVGGTGYTGAELLRLLAAHPKVAIGCVCSRSAAGQRVSDVFPSLRQVVDLEFVDPSSNALRGCDLVFFATPNGTAMRMAPALLDAGVRVIDLAADFRLGSASQWAHWYAEEHACPALLSEAVYGLPETNRERIRGARLVANPGCYPTAVQLGFLPLVESNAVDCSCLIADVKSGVSGAGRKESLATQLCEASENFKAYSVPGHRHLPEIREQLERAGGGPVGLTFVPHLAPMVRGIHATGYARLIDPGVDLQGLFSTRYEDEPFVDVLPSGSHPETRSVRGANVCRIAWHRPQDGDMVVVLVVEDNLVKGAAGQAIQNMNLMLGLPETDGLSLAGVIP